MTTNILLAAVVTILTGFIDSVAFDKAPQIWSFHRKRSPTEFFKVLIIFTLGAIGFIISTYFLQDVENPITLTLIWFVVTISSVSLAQGKFLKLAIVDKALVIFSIVLIVILYSRGVS